MVNSEEAKLKTPPVSPEPEMSKSQFAKELFRNFDRRVQFSKDLETSTSSKETLTDSTMRRSYSQASLHNMPRYDDLIRSLEKRLESSHFELKPPSFRRESVMRRSYSQRALANLAERTRNEATPHDKLLNEIRSFKFPLNQTSSDTSAHSDNLSAKPMIDLRISEESVVPTSDTSLTSSRIHQSFTVAEEKKQPVSADAVVVVLPLEPESCQVKKVKNETSDQQSFQVFTVKTADLTTEPALVNSTSSISPPSSNNNSTSKLEIPFSQNFSKTKSK